MKILALFKILIQAPLAVKATLAVATITTLSFAAFPEVPQFINNVMPNSFRHLNTKILKQAFEAVSPQAESVQDDILGVQDDKRNQGDDKGKQTGDRREGAVLAESTTANPGRLDINIPAFFNDPVSFNSASIFSGGLKVEGSSQLNLLTVNGAATFNENLTAPNVIYSLLAGTGIGITSGQTPTITNTGVTSLQDSTGALTFTAGSGMTISGLTITNNDKGTDQKIFKTISDGSTTFSAGSNTDTLTFAAGSGLSLSIDTSNKKVTFSSGSGGTAWTLNSTSLYPSSTTYNVGIGTTSPSYKLDVTGTGRYTSQLLLTGVPSSSASGGGSIYINPASATADYTLFGVSVGGTEKLRIDAEGDIHIQGSIISTTPGTVGYWSRVSTNTYLGNSGDLVGIGTSAPAAGIEVVRNGAASLSGGLFSGTWYSGGSSTTTKPQLLVEPTGTTSTAWSTSGTGLGVNAASGFTGNLIDAQVGGASKLTVSGSSITASGAYTFQTTTGNTTLKSGNGLIIIDATDGVTINRPLMGLTNDFVIKNSYDTQGTRGIFRSLAYTGKTSEIIPWTYLEQYTHTITGNYTTQRFLNVEQSILSAATSLGVTNAVQFNIDGAPKTAASATITNAIGLKIGAGSVSGGGTVTNAYGLYVDAPTGATNNYAAVFNTGNVGIGTTAPGAKLEVAGGGIIFPDSSSISVRQSGGVTAVINGISGTNYVGIPGGIYAQTSSGTNFVTWYPSGVAGGGMSFSGTATNTSINLAPSGTGSVNVNSAVSTGTTTSSGFVVNANSLNSGTGAYFTSSTLTTGKLVDISNTSNTQTTGTMFNISSTATSLTTGSLASLDWSPGSVQTTAATGNLFNINIGSNASNFAGNLFNVGDAGSSIFSISKSAVTTSLPVSMTAPGDMSIAYDINMTNPTASFVKSLSALTLQAGESFNSSDLTLKTYNQGSVVVDSAVTTGTGVDIQNTTLTTGYGLSFTGPSSTGITGSALYAISDIGSAGKLVNLAPDFSGSAVTGYGIYNAGTDSTAAANTNYGYYGSLTMTGNAAKNGYGIYQTVTSSSTTADTIYAADLATSVTGAISSGTRTVYGLRSQPASTGASSGTQTLNLYGGYFNPSSTLATAGTTNVYGQYISSTASHNADAGTVNQYGLYIANGTSSTNGTSTKYGLYVESPTGADTNYAIYTTGGLTLATSGSSGGIVFSEDNKRIYYTGETGGADANLISFRTGSTCCAAIETGAIRIAGTLTSAGVGIPVSTSAWSVTNDGAWTLSPTTGANATTLTLTGAAYTNQTASTELSDVNFNLARTVQFATGALATQRAVKISAPTYGFVAASTLTDSSTLAISGAPVAGTNATVTNAYALNIAAGAVGAGTTNAYGLAVAAPTGATNNYAAIFTGGNVGIGTTAPVAGLENAIAGAASKPAGLLSGTWFTGGTSTTTKPQLLIEPTGTTSTAWSTAGTGLGVNAATGFAGNFLDFQMNGSSRTKINYRGNLTVTDLGTEVLFAGAGGVRISAGAFIPNVAIYRDGYAALEMYRPYIRLGAGAQSSGSELYAANVDPGTLTITSGFATQRFTQFIQPTITAASALNISSEATTLSISGAPISAGSATIANAYGIKVDSGTSVAAGVTNAYGLAVAAPTGATNNYAAVFTGGNVGIGTTAPTRALEIAAVNGNSDLKLGGYIYMAAGQLVGNSGADYIQFNSNDNTVHSNQQITNRVYANNGVIRFLIGNAYPEIMRITAGGNVGIGTTAPSAALEVKASGTGVIAKFTSTNTTGCTLADGGTISCSSDRRLKKNIESLPYGLDTIMALNAVEYHWNTQSDSTVKSIGFIAQEVETVVPNLVITDPSSGQKQLNTIGLVPVLAKALQELNHRVNNLTLSPSSQPSPIKGEGDNTIPSPLAGEGQVFDSEGLSPQAQTRRGEGDAEATLSAKLATLESKINNLEASLSAVLANNVILSDNEGSLADASSSAETSSEILRSAQNDTSWSDLIAQAATASANLSTPSPLTGEGWGEGDLTISNTLKSLGKTYLGDTTIAGNFSVDGTMSISGSSINSLSSDITCHSREGGNLIDGSPTESGMTTERNDNCEDTLGILYIQDSPLASVVDFFNGKVKITKEGTISAQKIETSKLVIARKNDEAISLGTAKILKGTNLLVIKTTAVTQNSKILITALEDTPTPLYVTDKVPGESFTVKIRNKVTQDIDFDWLIVDSN